MTKHDQNPLRSQSPRELQVHDIAIGVEKVNDAWPGVEQDLEVSNGHAKPGQLRELS